MFYKDFIKQVDFITKQFVYPTNLKNNFRVIGAYQQSKEVEALDPENFPFGEVVEFETIMDYYENYYIKGKKK